MSTGIL